MSLKKNKFKLQENQYEFPYHHLVNFEDFELYKSLDWGIEYYSYVNEIIKLGKLLGKEVAEVGCGDGKITIELAKRYPNKHFEGYDLVSKAILFAKAFGYNIKNLKFFDRDFKLSRKKYDSIICAEVLEHIPDKDMKLFISIIHSKLKKNGKFIITVPSKNIKPLHPKHYRHYDAKLLQKTLEDKFEIEKLKYIHPQKSKKIMFLSAITTNKLFLLKYYKLKRKIAKKIQKTNFYTNSKKGRHLFAICKKT